ncbi:MAG: ATP synthase F0 subunit B [Bacilli bacterium]|nr:ATP synthase F0 subunit B [Bacilli bacterium]
MLFLADGPIDPESILAKIIPTFWPFIVQLIAFIILFVAVFFLAYKPVKKFLKKRNDYVKSNIDASRENELASAEKLKAADASLTSSYKEAKQIISNAKVDAEKERIEIINKAKEEAKMEKIKAGEEIQQEIKKSQDEIHQQMVDIALLASEKILEREVSSADNQKRVDNFIKDIQNN